MILRGLVTLPRRDKFENFRAVKCGGIHDGKILRKRRLNSGVTKRDAFTMQLRLDIHHLYSVRAYCGNVRYLIFYGTYARTSCENSIFA